MPTGHSRAVSNSATSRDKPSEHHSGSSLGARGTGGGEGFYPRSPVAVDHRKEAQRVATELKTNKWSALSYVGMEASCTPFVRLYTVGR